MKKIGIFTIVCIIAALTFVSCGGGNSVNTELNNTFTGSYFTIDCTYDFSAVENEVGAILTEKNTGLQIEVAGMPMMESKKGNTKSLDSFLGDIKNDANNATIKTVKIDGHKALWIEAENDGQKGIMAMIPMDGWVLINNVKTPGNTPESFELSKQIIKSLKITNPDFMKDAFGIPEEHIPENKPPIRDNSKKPEKEDTIKDEPEKEIEAEKPVKDFRLEQSYTGNYFTISHHRLAEINDYRMGDDDMVMFMVEKLNVTIIATKEQEEMIPEEEMGIEYINISGKKAKLLEMDMGSAFASHCVIDMDGWWILIIGTSEGDEVSTDMAMFREMLDSFEITKPDYLN